MTGSGGTPARHATTAVGSNAGTTPGVRGLRAAAALLAVLAGAPGCLVLSLNPAYDHETVSYDPALVGRWQDDDDMASLLIERGEWRSYRVHYTYPVENGTLTAYLSTIGDAQYLDLMPGRGEDRGSLLAPVHAVVRVALSGDDLELTPLSYDWFFDRVRHARLVPGIDVVLDQKENALIVSPAARFREWLRRQPATGAMFGAPARFRRVTGW